MRLSALIYLGLTLSGAIFVRASASLMDEDEVINNQLHHEDNETEVHIRKVPKQTTQAPKQTTQSPEQTAQSPKQKTQSPEQTTESPEQTTESSTYECPEGFFGVKGSSRCFKLFEDDYYNWEEAQTKCQQAGLVQPIRTDIIATKLRKYILETYVEGYIWLGARGDGTDHFTWHEDQSRLSKDNSLWGKNQPYFKDGCLYLAAVKSDIKTDPWQPYMTLPCPYGQAFALCEEAVASGHNEL